MGVYTDNLHVMPEQCIGIEMIFLGCWLDSSFKGQGLQSESKGTESSIQSNFNDHLLDNRVDVGRSKYMCVYVWS